MLRTPLWDAPHSCRSLTTWILLVGLWTTATRSSHHIQHFLGDGLMWSEGAQDVMCCPNWSRSGPAQANEALHFSAVGELNQICLGRIKLWRVHRLSTASHFIAQIQNASAISRRSRVCGTSQWWSINIAHYPSVFSSSYITLYSLNRFLRE